MSSYMFSTANNEYHIQQSHEKIPERSDDREIPELSDTVNDEDSIQLSYYSLYVFVVFYVLHWLVPEE